MAKRSVFLSYQRRSSSVHARYLNDKMQEWRIDVFLDVEDITQGRFDEIIEREIAKRDYFIVILTPTTLQSEWVVREIEAAIRHRKQIISVLMDGFDFNQPLPPSITTLKFYHGIQYIHEYAESFFEKLKQALRSNLSLPTAKQPTVQSYTKRRRTRELRQFWMTVGGMILVAAVALGVLGAYIVSDGDDEEIISTEEAVITTEIVLPTEEVTLEPTTPTSDANLRLVYTETYAYLLNIGTQNIDIGNLRFVQGNAVFEAAAWRSNFYRDGSRGSIDALPPNGCYQVLRVNVDNPPMPEGCPRRFGWVSRFSNRPFWLPADATSFQVYQYDAIIAECEFEGGMCEFLLP